MIQLSEIISFFFIPVSGLHQSFLIRYFYIGGTRRKPFSSQHKTSAVPVRFSFFFLAFLCEYVMKGQHREGLYVSGCVMGASSPDPSCQHRPSPWKTGKKGDGGLSFIRRRVSTKLLHSVFNWDQRS